MCFHWLVLLVAEEAGVGEQVHLGIHLSSELEAVLEQVVVLQTLGTDTWIPMLINYIDAHFLTTATTVGNR